MIRSRSMTYALRALFAASAMIVGCQASGRSEPTHSPAARQPAGLVIAHRGASGYLPEHTLPAYELAIRQGADIVEPDVVLTRDGVPICLHDITLERTTNVAEVFPDRARDDGRWYAADFSLREIEQLEIRGLQEPIARAAGESREQLARQHRIPTLARFLELIRAHETASGRSIGVIPELKRPSFHRGEGLSLEKAALSVLAQYGYERADDACIIQCFEFDALKRLRDEHGSELRLVYLAGNRRALERPGSLAEIAAVANAIGPNRRLIEETDGALVREAHAAGLKVYPWTFGAEQAAMVEMFYRFGVDGLFTDYPDLGVAARNARNTPRD